VEVYGNQSGGSGITGYEIGADFILVKFIGGSTYCYTYRSTGKRAIEMMKKLAKAGKGLSTYISQNIRDKYQRVSSAKVIK
jgi:hypothetical protein